MSEIQPDYKAALFEVLQHLAHTEDHGCDKRLLAHLDAHRVWLHQHGHQAEALAMDEAVRHLVLHQTNRRLEPIALRGQPGHKPTSQGRPENGG